MKRSAFFLVMSLLWIPTAQAQLWNPLGTVPRPNAVIAHDTSVTMMIDSGCVGCHSPGNSRLEQSKGDILSTLPLFRGYFTFGSYQYSGCDYAKINRRVIPTPSNPSISYNQVINSIQNARACDRNEDRWPAGSVGRCATPGCSMGEFAVVQQLIQVQLPGFDPLLPFKHVTCTYNCAASGSPCTGGGNPIAETLCMRGACYHIFPVCTGGGRFDAIAVAAAAMAGIRWPRWEHTGLTPAQVRAEFCEPMRGVLRRVLQALIACKGSSWIVDTSVINTDAWCQPAVIANSACAPGSPLANTCICDSENPGCVDGGVPVSSCGNNLTWKARQQVAVCEANDSFNTFYSTQNDNVVGGGCRENAAVFFTDGYMGHTPGTAVEASTAQVAYRSASGVSNMAVFRVANSFAGQANAMMSAVSQGHENAAYPATDATTMQVSFARILNRIYKGVYTGGSQTFDNAGMGAAFHTFTVPGYSATGPVSDDYLGWPARISWHDIDPNGNLSSRPTWETDWTSKNGPAAGCMTRLGGQDVNQLGPGGNFPSRVNRSVTIPANSVDRDGNGSIDSHPSLHWGSMYSIGTTRPVIVDAPREAPAGRNAGNYINFMMRQQVRERPRAIFSWGNGYLHGFYGGSYSPNSRSVGFKSVDFSYNTNDAQAGRTILRYRPNWVNHPGARYNYSTNNLVQQPITTGQLVTRDVFIDVGGGDEYRTVLVGAQGTHGPGMFTLDVTDPCAIRLLAEFSLPRGGDVASSNPMIYDFPTPTGQVSVVMMTGGLSGSNNLYAFNLRSGAIVDQIGLPRGTYPTSPVCVDSTGEGRITHCYVVSNRGRSIRVTIDIATGRFMAARDMTPPGVGGGSLIFSTQPVVFFGGDGNINILYGSGDHRHLTEGGGQNYVYLIVDRSVRKAGVPNETGDVANACNGSNTSGIFPLGAGERVVSPPIVGKGIVSWTSYRPGSSACVAGRANLYAINYQTCADAIGNNQRPTGHGVGPGIPTSPTLHRDSDTIHVGTSAGPTAAQTVATNVRSPHGRRPAVKRLYWRVETNTR